MSFDHPAIFKSSAPLRTLTSVIAALGLGASASFSVAAPVLSTPQVFNFQLSTNNVQPDPFSFFLGPFVATTSHDFNAFDPGLGTLQQVIFTWQSPLTASFAVDPDDQGTTVDAYVDATLTGLGSLLSGSYSATAPAGAAAANISEAVDGTRTYSAPAELAYFVGTGTFTAALGLTVNLTPDNSSADMSASWGTATNLGRLTLQYLYDSQSTVQVPEPGVLILGSATVIAFGLTARRRRKSRH